MFRKGIPKNTPTRPTIEDFLLRNTRCPAIKLGAVVVGGYRPDSLELIASRLPPNKSAILYENFTATAGPGVAFRKAPTLPPPFKNQEIGAVVEPIGIAVLFSSIPATINFISGARVMGTIETLRQHLMGRKFFVINRWNDFICVELA